MKQTKREAVFRSSLKEILRKKGYTVRELSEITGLSTRTISTYSKPSLRNIDTRVAAALIDALQVDFEDLFNYQHELGNLQAA